MYVIHFSKVYCVKRENIVVRYKYEKKCRHEPPAFFKFLQTILKEMLTNFCFYDFLMTTIQCSRN